MEGQFQGFAPLIFQVQGVAPSVFQSFLRLWFVITIIDIVLTLVNISFFHTVYPKLEVIKEQY